MTKHALETVFIITMLFKKRVSRAEKVLFLFSDLLKVFTAIFTLTSKLVIDLHIFEALKKGKSIRYSTSSTD